MNLEVGSWTLDNETFILRMEPALGLDGVMYYYKIAEQNTKVYITSVEDVDWGNWPSYIIALIRLPLVITHADLVYMKKSSDHFYQQGLTQHMTINADWATCDYKDEIKSARALGMDFTLECPPTTTGPQRVYTIK